MLSNVYDICTVVAHLRVSHAHELSVRIHHRSPAVIKKAIKTREYQAKNQVMVTSYIA